LCGIETFEGDIESFILNTFINFKPVQRFQNRSGVSEFRSFNNGTSKGVLDLLETMYLTLSKIVVQRVTVIKFGMYYGGCNDTGRFGIKIRTDAAKLTNVLLVTTKFANIQLKYSLHTPQLYRQVLLYRVLAMAILSVRPSVCLSVTTRWQTKPR